MQRARPRSRRWAVPVALALVLAAVTLGGCRRAGPETDAPDASPAPTPTPTPTPTVTPGSDQAPAPREPATGAREEATPSDLPPETDDAAAPGAFDPTRDPLEGREIKPVPGGREPRTRAGCEDGRYAVGEQWKQDCNTCVCGPDGQATCTLMACGAGR